MSPLLNFSSFSVSVHITFHILFTEAMKDLPYPSSKRVFCQMWVHLHKYFSPQVVSHVFCLPPNYRKDVLPPTGTENYFWTMNNSELPSDFIFMFPIWESLKISVNFDVSRICLHDFSQNPTKSISPNSKENMRICCLSEDGGPLSVFFKLPISEISEIDDHKSVRVFIFLLSVSEVFELLKIDIRTLTHWLFSLSYVPKMSTTSGLIPFPEIHHIASHFYVITASRIITQCMSPITFQWVTTSPQTVTLCMWWKLSRVLTSFTFDICLDRSLWGPNCAHWVSWLHFHVR